jgi:hypothetical protein
MSLAKIFLPQHAKYDYKKYFFDNDGNRLAGFCEREQTPDLQSCAIRNPNGLQVLRHLMLDLDAHRAEDRWLDINGALDWPKIKSYLSEKYPLIFAHIEYALKSYSKKGIHILFGFNPFSLEQKTYKTQRNCYLIQNYLIEIFKTEGLGVDPAARGLNRDFSSFRNEDNILFHNKILTKRIKNERFEKDVSKKTPFLSNLFNASKSEFDRIQKENTCRLYNNAIVEEKFARLFLYTLGEIEVKNENNKQKEQIEQWGFNQNNFVKCKPFEPVTLNLKQIEIISGLSPRSIKDLDFCNLREANKLWDITKNADKTITLTAKNTDDLKKKIERAKQIYKNQKAVTKKVDPKLIRPELVQDGERNLAIWSWAVYYKMAGYSELEALEKINLRIKWITNFESSQECKSYQIKNTVRSIYRNRKETFGIKPDCLPDFLADDSFYFDSGLKLCPILEPSNTRREPPPALSIAPIPACPAVEEENKQNPVTLAGESKIKPDLILINSVFAENSNIKKIDTTKINAVNLSNHKLTVVRYNRKIGIFNEDKLILCVTDSRHYKLKNLIPKLKTIVSFELTDKNFFHPKKNNKKLRIWNAKIDKEKHPISSDILCGRKKSFAKKILEFKNKNDKQFDVTQDKVKNDFDCPF